VFCHLFGIQYITEIKTERAPCLYRSNNLILNMVSETSFKVIIWTIQTGSVLKMFPYTWNQEEYRFEQLNEPIYQTPFWTTSFRFGITTSRFARLCYSLIGILNLVYMIIFFLFCDHERLDLYLGWLLFIGTATALSAQTQLFAKFEEFISAMNSFLILDRKIRKF